MVWGLAFVASGDSRMRDEIINIFYDGLCVHVLHFWIATSRDSLSTGEVGGVLMTTRVMVVGN